MRMLGERSLVSFLKVLTDIAFWGLVGVTALIVLALIPLAVVGTSNLSLDLPARFAIDPSAYEIAPRAGGAGRVMIEDAEADVLIQGVDRSQALQGLAVAFLAVGVGLAVVYHLRGIFRSLRDRRPFVQANVQRIRVLAYYAEHFDTVEVNSSFYRLPDAAVTKKWAAQTPPGFDFCLKLFQKFTHPAMYLKGAGARAGGEETSIPVVTSADVDAFRQAIDPLPSAGKLGALLVQFPPSFRHGDGAREYLAWLMRAFSDYPVADELRHRSWSDHEQGVLALLQAHRAAWVQIDEPKFRFSIQQSHLPNLGSLYYMRLHGRNAEKWWTHDHPDERYNYLYSPAEVDGFADTVTRVRQLVQKIYVFMNNHFAGKAVANAMG